MKITRELKTGIVSVVIIGLSIWGFNYLKGQDLFNSADVTYFSEFDNVQGLNTASIVTINGLQVGKVERIKFMDEPGKNGKLLVEFGVETNLEFSKNSTVKIYSTSIMGGSAIAILPSYEGEKAVSGDKFVGTIEADLMSSVSETLTPLKSKLENVLVSVDSVMLAVNQIMDYETRKNLKESFAKLNNTLSGAESSLATVDSILTGNKDNIDKSLGNFKKSTENLVAITDSLAAANLGATIEKLDSTVTSFNAILAEAQSGEGTLGKFLKDEAVYNNIENATKELEELLREMKEHPKRFVHFSVFGKKDKGYQPNEED
ncbi:MlaD family protein [Urechidicola sp. KH5]